MLDITRAVKEQFQSPVDMHHCLKELFTAERASVPYTLIIEHILPPVYSYDNKPLFLKMGERIKDIIKYPKPLEGKK